MALTPSSIRNDLKCGKGSISPGEKCSKGPATQAERVTGRKSAEGQFNSIVSNSAVGQKFFHAKAPTRTTEQRLRRAGEVATRVASVGLMAHGYWNSMSGAASGRLGKGLAGIAEVNAGMAGWRAADASKAKRMGADKLAAKFNSAARARLGIAAGVGAAAYGVNRYENQRFGTTGSRNSPGGSRGPSGSGGGGGYSSSRTRPNAAVKDPFKDLGVKANASDADIKRAWIKLMQENHPDAGGDPERAKTINAAYQEIKRRRRRDSIWADGFDVDFDGLSL